MDVCIPALKREWEVRAGRVFVGGEHSILYDRLLSALGPLVSSAPKCKKPLNIKEKFLPFLFWACTITNCD
jgi:hypothetical protein